MNAEAATQLWQKARKACGLWHSGQSWQLSWHTSTLVVAAELAQECAGGVGRLNA